MSQTKQFIQELIAQQDANKQLRETIENVLNDSKAFNKLVKKNVKNVEQKHANNFISQIFQVFQEQDYRQLTNDEIETLLGIENCSDVVFKHHDWFFSVNSDMAPVIPIAFKQKVKNDN